MTPPQPALSRFKTAPALQPLSHDINSAKIKSRDEIKCRAAAADLALVETEAVKTMGPVGERAIGVLVSAMEDPSAPWSCRIHAASLVADRAFGRAPQSVSLEVTRRLNDLTLDELRQPWGFGGDRNSIWMYLPKVRELQFLNAGMRSAPGTQDQEAYFSKLVSLHFVDKGFHGSEQHTSSRQARHASAFGLRSGK